jgi:Short C-terminal domain
MRMRRGGLARGVARTAVVAGTASAVSGRVHHRQQQRYAAEEDAQYAQEQYAAQQAAPPPAAAGDDMAELQKLADLHAQGILTDEEFAAKKKQILGI